MNDTDKQELIKKLFAEKLGEKVVEIDPYDFGTFTVETANKKAYFVGGWNNVVRLAVQETMDRFHYCYDGNDKDLLKFLDEIWYFGMDKREVLDIVRELFDPEHEMPELDDLESFSDFRHLTGLTLEGMMNHYGLDPDAIKPHLKYYDICVWIVDEDGVGNTLARYDSKEIWLGNGLFAYRVG
jgi:hypothetical protein